MLWKQTRFDNTCNGVFIHLGLGLWITNGLVKLLVGLTLLLEYRHN